MNILMDITGMLQKGHHVEILSYENGDRQTIVKILSVIELSCELN